MNRIEKIAFGLIDAIEDIDRDAAFAAGLFVGTIIAICAAL